MAFLWKLGSNPLPQKHSPLYPAYLCVLNSFPPHFALHFAPLCDSVPCRTVYSMPLIIVVTHCLTVTHSCLTFLLCISEQRSPFLPQNLTPRCIPVSVCVCVFLFLSLSFSLSDPLLFSSVLLFLIVFQILYNRSPTQAQCSFSVLQLLLRFLLNVSILQQIKSCLRNYFVLRKGTTIKLTSSVIQSHQSLCHLATFSDTNFTSLNFIRGKNS